MQPIEQTIHAFVQEMFLFGQDGFTLTGDTSFLENGIIDSTGVLELVSFLEETYAIRIADDELAPDNLDSINRVTRFVRQKLGVAAVGSAA